LSEVLARMREPVAKHVRAPVIEAAAGGAETAGGETAAAGVPGQIRNREDAVRSLEAVADFFRRSEPSSPVPMFVDRAKRLISRDFLEVLAELAPDSLAAVKQVGGIREAE
jgi:type VI secretion system protein ImpA